MKTTRIGPFDGVISALDPRSIKPTAAQKALNVRVDDGRIALRYGFKNLQAAQGSFTSFNGANYIQGYSGTLEKEEYVTFEKIGSTVKPFRRAVAGTSSPVEITNGGSSLSLHDSDWLMVAHQENGYAINPNETASVYRHVIGTDNSFLALTPPTAPVLAPTYSVSYPSATAGYTRFGFTGALTADVTYTGIGSSTGFAVNSDGSMTIGHTNVTGGAASFEIDLSAHIANQDWSYNDVLFFTIQGEPGAGTNAWDIDRNSLIVTLYNADGTPVAFVPTSTQVEIQDHQVGGARAIYGVRIQFTKADRTLWDNIKRIKVAYTVTANSGLKLRMSPWTLGGVWMVAPPDGRTANADGVSLTYSYWTGVFESGMSPELYIPKAILKGNGGLQLPGGIDPLGVHLLITFVTSSDASVTDNRLYSSNHRVVTQADSGTTYTYRMTYEEMLLLSEYVNITPFKSDKCVNAFSHKGSVVWLYKGGYQNVRYSRIGDAEKQASELDQDDDLSRGETFTLADNLSDEPLGGASAGSTVLIAGQKGIYSQVGDYPPTMSPCKRLSDSHGCAGKFALCAFTDDSGNPGMAFMSTTGQVCFALANPSYQGDDGGRVIVLSAAIDTGEMSPGTFLRDGQGLSSFATCRLGVDHRTGTLHVVMGKRALKFVRSASGQRYWEPVEHAITGTWAYLAFSTKRFMRACRSSGQFDEWEWDTAGSRFIAGANRDDGSPVPTPYWQSKTIRSAQNTRIVSIRVVRASNVDRPSVVIYSERTPEGNLYQCESGKQNMRTGIANMGREFSYKIGLPDSDGTYSAIEIEESAVGRPHF